MNTIFSYETKATIKMSNLWYFIKNVKRQRNKIIPPSGVLESALSQRQQNVEQAYMLSKFPTESSTTIYILTGETLLLIKTIIQLQLLFSLTQSTSASVEQTGLYVLFVLLKNAEKCTHLQKQGKQTSNTLRNPTVCYFFTTFNK